MARKRNAQESTVNAQESKGNEVKEVLTMAEIMQLPLTERAKALQEMQSNKAKQALKAQGSKSSGFSPSNFKMLPLVKWLLQDFKAGYLTTFKDLTNIDCVAPTTLSKEFNTSPKQLESNRLQNETHDTNLTTDLLFASTFNDAFKSDLIRGFYSDNDDFKSLNDAFIAFKDSKEYKAIEDAKDKAEEVVKWRSNFIETDESTQAVLNSIDYKVGFYVERIEEELSVKYVNTKKIPTTVSYKSYNQFMLIGGIKAVESFIELRSTDKA